MRFASDAGSKAQAQAIESKLGRLLARFRQRGMGRAGLLCPGSSDVDLLGDRESVVDLNTEISNCAFDLRMAKQELNGSQVARTAVYQRGLGSTE